MHEQSNTKFEECVIAVIAGRDFLC